MTDTQQFNVDAGLFMQVRRAVSTDETRYYMQGVYIEPDPTGGVLMIATNGIVMLVARDAMGYAPRPAIIKLDLLAGQETEECGECGDYGECDECDECGAGQVPRSYSGALLQFRVGRPGTFAVATINSGRGPDTCGVVQNIDGTFPNWRKPLTDRASIDETTCDPEGSDWGFDTRWLNQMCDGAQITMDPPVGRRPSRVFFVGQPNIFGIIMPLNGRGASDSRALCDAVEGAAIAAKASS